MSRLPLKIIKQTNDVHTASVIFFHGSGDTAKGLIEWINFLIPNFTLPHVKFVFPTAPVRPYTPNGGQPSNVWFDRYDINPDVPDHEETLNEIKEDVKNIIEDEVKAGIPLKNIVIGGFSMGGALSLHTAYRFVPGLGGVFALSSFLNKDSLVYKNITSTNTPLFMCHGALDQLVPLEWGKETFTKLQELGVKGEFHEIHNALHELKAKELEKLLKWISAVTK